MKRLLSLVLLLATLTACIPQVQPSAEYLTMTEAVDHTEVALTVPFDYEQGVVYFGGTRAVTSSLIDFECDMFNQGVLCVQVSETIPAGTLVTFMARHRSVPPERVSVSAWLTNFETKQEVIATGRYLD